VSEPTRVFGVAVLAPRQKAAAEAHCFGDCGKLSMGGVIADELTGGLCVCCEPVCPYMAKEMPEYGSTMSFGRPHTITLRLLEPEDEA
jgi:hypothetical protein